MTSSAACLLGGEGAVRFALNNGFFPVKSNEELVTPEALAAFDQWALTKDTPTSNEMTVSGGGGGEAARHGGGVGTVGAVVLDGEGNLAAATSTGGLVGKEAGRIGDSPLIGCGTFADNKLGAVSTTGAGESILRCLLASDIAHTLLPMHSSCCRETPPVVMTSSIHPNDVIKSCLKSMTDRVGGDGGAICLTPNGQVGIEWNSLCMSWAVLHVVVPTSPPAVRDAAAAAAGDQEEQQPLKIRYGCYRGENFERDLTKEETASHVAAPSSL